jgi:energy-converting hydrogenase Eha subunit A
VDVVWLPVVVNHRTEHSQHSTSTTVSYETSDVMHLDNEETAMESDIRAEFCSSAAFARSSVAAGISAIATRVHSDLCAPLHIAAMLVASKGSGPLSHP